MSLTRRITGYLLALLLAFSGQAHAQLALTGAGKALAAAGGGGGGGDEVAVSTDIAAYFVEGNDGATGTASPGGANRALFAGVATIHAGPPTIDDAKYGGAGGTSLTRLGADETFDFGGASVAAWGAAGSPSGSTTIWGDWSGTPLMAFTGGVFLENVNQTSPFEGYTVCQGADGGPVTTASATCTVSGMTAGQKAVAVLMCSSGSASITAVTSVAGTTLLTNQAFFFNGSMAYLYREASGTSVQLDATCNQSSGSYITWKILAVRINPV